MERPNTSIRRARGSTRRRGYGRSATGSPIRRAAIILAGRRIIEGDAIHNFLIHQKTCKHQRCE